MSDAERPCSKCALTFEMLIADPLTRAMMDSDGVQLNEMIALLEHVWETRVQRHLNRGVEKHA